MKQATLVLAALAVRGRSRPDLLFQPGEVIFRPGDPAGEAYLIVSGSVELLAPSGGRLVRVALCGPGDVFGEMALIEEQPRSLTARATLACRATTLSRPEFEEFLTQNPEKCLGYLRSLFGRLRESSERAAFADGTKPQHPVLVSVTIRPLTPRAAESAGGEVRAVTRYPFRIGRATEGSETPAAEALDLSIRDRGPYYVSRRHAALAQVEGGGLVVLDQGSRLGTLVNGQRIGRGRPAQQAPLPRGDNVLVLGSRDSPFQFEVTVGGAG
jgi:CRP-like cAMP-binding protein